MNATKPDLFVEPSLTSHSSLDDAAAHVAMFGGLDPFRLKTPIRISDIPSAKRTLIVGEPGSGKTRLLQELRRHLDAQGIRTLSIELKKPESLSAVDTVLKDPAFSPEVLLLDALDEVRGNLLPETLDKLDELASAKPALTIVLSSRWVYINRYSNRFPDYRFVLLSPFSLEQVVEYLKRAGRKEDDVELVLSRLSKFGHVRSIIQIPRYLSCLNSFLERRRSGESIPLSRIELLEDFIYSKLDVEEKKLNRDTKLFAKRLLEKLALAMEVAQSNRISLDEVATFFDELKSDLKTIALSQVSLDTLIDFSLLKLVGDKLDRVEFENTEFQEYLAAKELTRFADPPRAAFSLAVDPSIQEVHPTWFNTLTFLADMHPGIVEQLVEFSGLRGDGFKAIDDAFLAFFARVEPLSLPTDARIRLLNDLLSYHERTLQWIPNDVAIAVGGLADAFVERTLRRFLEQAEAQQGPSRFVRLGNIALVVGCILGQGVALDKMYWRKWLLACVNDKNENGVLQRHALAALVYLGDQSVLDELPDLLGSDDLVAQQFLATCRKLNPDSPKSLSASMEATRRGNFHGRYGLLALRSRTNLRDLLAVLSTERPFLHEFLDDAAIFKEKDDELISHIECVLDDEILDLCEAVLLESMDCHIADGAAKSHFAQSLYVMLRKHRPGIAGDLVCRISKRKNVAADLHAASTLLSEVLEPGEVPQFVQAMIAIEQSNAVFWTLQAARISGRLAGAEVFEAGRAFLPEQYRQWDLAQEAAAKQGQGRDPGTQRQLERFRSYLGEEGGNWNPRVFEVFNQHAHDLVPLISENERTRLLGLAVNTVLRQIEPAKCEVKIEASSNGGATYTTSSHLLLFGDALTTADSLAADITSIRQKIVDFIPFAFPEDLRTAFHVLGPIGRQELSSVVAVYANKKSDVWRYQTDNFIETCEAFQVGEAVPVLKEMVAEPLLSKHTRRHALEVVASIDHDPEFLRLTFSSYGASQLDPDRELAETANGLLITQHNDKDAVSWRLRQVVEKAAPFVPPSGCHSVGPLEEEILGGMLFAKPLMLCRDRSFIGSYLELLEQAMEVWGKGRDFYTYAQYLWKIVIAYFLNLKDSRSYEPLMQLERKVAKLRNMEGANWLAANVVSLRRAYLAQLGKPANMSEAVARVNEARAYNAKAIRNSVDLFQQVKGAVETDLKRWIESEGAYSLIVEGRVISGKRQEYEKLIQRTIKAQIENFLIRRGFNVDFIREPQLLDERRTDFVVRYGFTGPVVIELKLSGNSDLRGAKIHQSASFVNLRDYMRGYGATHGMLLVVDNVGAKNLAEVRRVFETIPGLWVGTFDCCAVAVARKAVPTTQPSVSVKKKTSKTKKRTK